MTNLGQTRSADAPPDGGPLDAFVAAGKTLVESVPADEKIHAIVDAAARATGADVAIARSADGAGSLVARAVAGPSAAIAAELEGSRLLLDDVPGTEAAEPEAASLRRAAERIGADAVLYVPVTVADSVVGSLELLRRGASFTDGERALARLATGQLSLVLTADTGANGAATLPAEELLRTVGDVLAAAPDVSRTAARIAAVAADASGAVAVLVWRAEGDAPELVATHGRALGAERVEAARDDVARALADHQSVVAGRTAVTVHLGQPPTGALQLFFDDGAAPSEDLLETIAGFAARAAHALREGERAERQAAELEQTRALLGAVAQAIAQLSLAHTLETSIERVSRLLETDRLAVYLLEADGHVLAAAGRGLAGPHGVVAERLLRIALGESRGRELLVVPDVLEDPRLRVVREASGEAGIEAAIATPLIAHDEVIGLLAAYPERGRPVADETATLVAALAAQLAVAVQNARLHEQAKRLGDERERALEAERKAARRLRALYEISGSFAQSLSLEATLEAVVRTVAELLDLDAVGARMPDTRTESLVLRAMHARDERMEGVVRAVLGRPQPLGPALRALFAGGRPIILEPEMASRLGGAYALLVPFLEKGSTAAIVPISTQAEVLGTLTLLSLDPARPIASEAVDLALSVAGHAALALDNARLYQAQKAFAESMQRSLLPDTRPQIAGLEVGEVYASSARVDVGGDVYDYLLLDDRTLAVVLGDVTGHGVDAAADMAMAKFVFRSLAREHPRPSDFLAAANDVVVDEIGAAKFITMAYLTIDAVNGDLACAAAGHPPPRILRADGSVGTVPASGLALGIDAGQAYDEVHVRLESGDAVVLYTDGVIEARRRGDLYGHDRFDATLAANAALPPEELAETIVADARAFGGGDLGDDCAVVVIKRVSPANEG